MNTQQLAVFREVMETGSVSAAARNLNRTQPAISASLKALEASLGAKLFHREGRRLAPVPEAHYLLSEAIGILDRLQTTKAHFQDMSTGESGELRVAAMPGTSAYLMPDFVSRFAAKKKDLRITLTTRSSPQVLNLIAAQNYDVGFCDVRITRDQAHLCASESLEGHCVVALSASHHLAKCESLTVSDLSGEPMGTLHDTHHIVDQTRQVFQSAKAEFNVKVQTQFFLPLLRFVETGSICAIIDPLSLVSYQKMFASSDAVRFVRLEPSLPFHYSIVTPSQRPLSSVAREFIEAWSVYMHSTLDIGQ
ncbi:LysR family transcriptional regulator [Shimia sp. CNT1-13L.2]|uniref:LysR family transcriptional regulator n=1 Tax=Shimia sp. CNT1-13L.2 TaxID=2959663 RepID=UPI0020CFB56A|nr:LysR family transcriptional regulator [Shimia sp. CNT1-13L.2]MCP9483437.1 LysR family transcriptional regulator [Shimia sp. CNT1-13L.2]